MAFEFKLPDIGEGLHEAELLSWKVKEGDTVSEDDPLLEVQTDKASVEITSPVKGKVVKLLGKVGDTLMIGSVVVIFDDGSAGTVPDEKQAAAAVAVAAPAKAEPKAPANVAPAPAAVVVAQSGGRALAAPATRKLARTLGLDINMVVGSGPAGRVTPDDVRNFTAGGAAASAEVQVPVAATVAPTAPVAYLSAPGAIEERMPLKGIRKVIADRMVQSKHTAPHVTIVEEVDMTAMVAFREKAKGMAAK